MKNQTTQEILPYLTICKVNRQLVCEESFFSFKLAVSRMTEIKKNMKKPCSFEASIYYFHNNKKKKLLTHNLTFYKD